MKPQTQERLKRLSSTIIDFIITGVICAIVSTLISTAILNNIEMESQNKKRVSLLSYISIGTNREWVDQSFGTPQYSATQDEYDLCAYTSDDFLLQVVYDKSGSVQGYLVTAYEPNKIKIDDLPKLFDNGVKIGSFSFYDFPHAPESVMGYFINGSGRVFYGETYYFASRGDYLAYHIAYVDYGFYKGTTSLGMFQETTPDEEITKDNISPNSGEIITNRKGFYPNTYGVSNIGRKMEELLFKYGWFDSMKLVYNQHYRE